jgi:hypothetical protein
MQADSIWLVLQLIFLFKVVTGTSSSHTEIKTIKNNFSLISRAKIGFVHKRSRLKTIFFEN